jgi:hypothetical protein
LERALHEVIKSLGVEQGLKYHFGDADAPRRTYHAVCAFRLATSEQAGQSFETFDEIIAMREQRFAKRSALLKVEIGWPPEDTDRLIVRIDANDEARSLMLGIMHRRLSESSVQAAEQPFCNRSGIQVVDVVLGRRAARMVETIADGRTKLAPRRECDVQVAMMGGMILEFSDAIEAGLVPIATEARRRIGAPATETNGTRLRGLLVFEAVRAPHRPNRRPTLNVRGGA